MEESPCPPANNVIGFLTSIRLIFFPVLISTIFSAMRSCLCFGTPKLVSFIRRGAKIVSFKYSSSDTPEATSTTRPRTSVDRPYSHVVPGSFTSGSVARVFAYASRVQSRELKFAAKYLSFTNVLFPNAP